MDFTCTTVWRKTHACSINGLIMVHVNLAIFMRFAELLSLSIFLLIQWDLCVLWTPWDHLEYQGILISQVDL